MAGQAQLPHRFPTGLSAVDGIAVNAKLAAVSDTRDCKIAVVDLADGTVRTIGRDRTAVYQPVSWDLLRAPKGISFLADGRLVVLELNRMRLMDLADSNKTVDIITDLPDTAATNPTDPSIVYTNIGIFKVDYKTGAWKWIVEHGQPTDAIPSKLEADRPMMVGRTIVLSGRPYLMTSSHPVDVLMYDLTDPLNPRRSTDVPAGFGVYATIAFGKNGDLINWGGPPNKVQFRVWPYKGLDVNNNPQWDKPKSIVIGAPADPNGMRGMFTRNSIAMAGDCGTGNVYFLADTKDRNGMTRGFGEPGIGKMLADGTPEWWVPSADGSNYMSIDDLSDGHDTWILGCQSVNGLTDVLDSYGLRLATGNWDETTGFGAFWVDLRYGLTAFVRPDRKLGAYVEDDSLGRMMRYRMEGARTLKRQMSSFEWVPGASPAADSLPDSGMCDGAGLKTTLSIPRIAPTAIDGDWSTWGIAPQIVILPSNITGGHNAPSDLLQTFRQATAIGGVVHDDANLYAYFLVADDNPHFDALKLGDLWRTDGIEFWVEEEQFGLGLLADGTPDLWKYRFYDTHGVPYTKQYALPRENVWATAIADMSANPLGKQLELITGHSLSGMKGYAVEAKIPYSEFKLSGGIAGRTSLNILPVTGQAGETIRIAVTLDKINATGRRQDYLTNWPLGFQFSDPSSSVPFVFGP